MRQNIIEQLVLLCSRVDIDFHAVGEFIKVHELCGYEVSRVAIKLADRYCLEYGQCRYELGREPEDTCFVSDNFVQLFELFLKYGMNPNFIVLDGSPVNVMSELYFNDNGTVGADTVRLLFEHGGNPNLRVDGESITSMVDFDFIWAVANQDEKRIINSKFHFWLVCMGYGGTKMDGQIPVVMKGDLKPEIFRQHELFDYRVKRKEKDWKLQVVYKESGEEVAYLE